MSEGEEVKRRRRRSSQEIQRLVAEFRTSGLRSSQFCRIHAPYLDNWFNGKKAETAPSPMAFYRGNLAKFVQFLGTRSNDPMAEVTKQDVVALRKTKPFALLSHKSQ